jgi:hypothetical protein
MSTPPRDTASPPGSAGAEAESAGAAAPDRHASPAAATTGRGWPGSPRLGPVPVLVAALVLIAALVISAPLWAPLMPWRADAADRVLALAARLDRLETAEGQHDQQIRQARLELAAAIASLQHTEKRIGALESRPAAAPVGADDIRQQLGRLTGATAGVTERVEALDKAVRGEAGLAARLDAVDRAVHSLRDLAARVDALDKAVHVQTAAATSDTGIALALLQVRAALDAGRPFVAEYEALAALASIRPELAAAVAPLAEPAKTGAASRPVLATRLRELAGAIAAARPAPAGGGWGEEALAQLRRLVTIRRIGAAAPSGSAEAAVDTAERALAGGDLDGAVAALDGLAGAPAEAAAPWLRMARQRLAAENAVRRAQALLATGLGNAAPAAGVTGR